MTVAKTAELPENLHRRLLIGIALTAAGSLMLEVALTRIFSVIMYSHLSLVAVSMAMLGLTLGGLIVHCRPGVFGPERVAESCGRAGAGLALGAVAILLYCLYIPFPADMDGRGVFWVVVWTLVLAIPFTCSGVVVCALLTVFPARSGTLYAADLLGSSLGCLAVVALMNLLPAPSVVLWVAALLGAAAWVLGRWPRQALVAALLALFAAVNSVHPLVRVQYSRGKALDRSQIERELWNAFSYISVTRPQEGAALSGPGRRFDFDKARRGRYRELKIDSSANTYMSEFHGDWQDMDWLLGDACEFVHHLRSDGPVLVIGPGGGRDVLAAELASRGQRELVGVDVNPSMIRMFTRLEAGFSGVEHLPGARFVVDEGRSWTARTERRFQVIAIPLVDTFAASSAGAYALTEHSLYTVEALELFLSRLREDGILSISRWYRRGKVGEVHRMAGMMAVALRHRGVADPSRHLLIVLDGQGTLANLMLSARPLTPRDLQRVTDTATALGLDVLFSPGSSLDPLLQTIVTDPNWATNCANIPLIDLSPATDDRPFFFYTARLGLLFARPGGPLWKRMDMAYRAPSILLATLCVLVLGVALIVLVVPPVVQARGVPPAAAWRAALYFGLVGAGFMFFEAAQLQRLILFLGYPVYGLTVVLMSLLLSSSLGSYASNWLWKRLGPATRWTAMAGTVLAIAALGPATGWVATRFVWADAWIRVALSMACVAPAGLFLGMAVPTGLRVFHGVPGVSLASAWAVNGATSTMAATLSIVLSLLGGTSLTYACGLAAYVMAAAVFLRQPLNPPEVQAGPALTT